LPDPSVLARLEQTTPPYNKGSGLAIITHPFHPLLGQSFEILSTRKVSGREVFSLRSTARSGLLAIPREWTDKADPDPYKVLPTPPPILSFPQLQLLTEFINNRSSGDVSTKKGVDS